MTDAALAYLSLEVRVRRGRAVGDMPEETDDTLLEEMDDLWRQMTPEDRAAANNRVQETQNLSAPADLQLRDVALPLGSRGLPRKVEQ